MFTPTYLIVGLGNPDEKYRHTFHNVGFLCLDLVAKKLGAKFNKGECRAITAHVRAGGAKIILAKPITYMNLSGFAVTELINKYKIEREKFLVIYDDVDLSLGQVRIRPKGSAGTHNGMRDVLEKTGTEEIFRVRIGIGQERLCELADYVLSKITDKEMEFLAPAISNAADAAYDFATGCGIAEVMQKHNKA